MMIATLERVIVGRQIWVGDNEAKFTEWLNTFVQQHEQGRQEGFVLDLTGGTVWATLDLSSIPDEAYKDIALRAVEQNDEHAVEALLRLTRKCDPVTAQNVLTTEFDSAQWPRLKAACNLFVGKK